MKRTFSTVCGFLFCFFAVTLWAQKSKKKPAPAKTVEKPAVATYKNYTTPIAVYLGHSSITGGTVPKQEFDSLLKEGLWGKDSSGVEYKVTGFNFNYAERNIYEDSTGGPMVLTDYMMEPCIGDTVDAIIAATIYKRTKAGDTVFIDQLKLLRPDNQTAAGKALKVVIGK